MRIWMLGMFLWLMSINQAFAEPMMIALTQTACQFVEAESKDYGFKTKQAGDCVKINQRTGDKRLAESKVLHLKAGNYVFRIYNRDVPYALGFWLRGQGLGRFTLPTISGGDIQTGAFEDYTISLKAGEYYYSCPLNPTPNYTLVVQ